MKKLILCMLFMCVTGVYALDLDSVFGEQEAYGTWVSRVEGVKAKSASDALGYTNQLTLGTQVADVLGNMNLIGGLEFSHVFATIGEYNTGSAVGPKKAGRATLVDPAQTRLTKAYIQYEHFGSSLRLGRQALAHSDHRFLGTVGWRQTDQTFDAVSLWGQVMDQGNYHVNYITARHGITDELSQRYSEGTLSAGFSLNSVLGVKPSVYALMIQNVHNTYSLRVDHKMGVGDYQVASLVEVASQSDPSFISGDSVSRESYFYRLYTDVVRAALTTGIGYEVLGEKKGSSVGGFSTPLATLHKYQGWSDVLLSSISGGTDAGLTDFFLKGAFDAGSLGQVKMTYHVFNSIIGSKSIGSELDACWKYALSDHANVLLKTAYFMSGNDFGTDDVLKVWGQTTVRF